MQLLIFGFKDCLLGDKIFKKNQRPAKKKKSQKLQTRNPPTNSQLQPFTFAAVTGKVSQSFSVVFTLEPLDILVLKPKHQLTAEAKSKANG